MILGFALEQLMQWLPWMFTRQTNDGDQTMVLASARKWMVRAKYYIFMCPNLQEKDVFLRKHFDQLQKLANKKLMKFGFQGS